MEDHGSRDTVQVVDLDHDEEISITGKLMSGNFEKGILEGKILFKIFDKNRLCTRFEKALLYWGGLLVVKC